MPQHLADLAERRTLSQQFAGQSVAKLMCAVSRGINSGALQPMSDYRSDATGTSETTDRRSGAEEDAPTGALRPTVSYLISHNTVTDLSKRKSGVLQEGKRQGA